MESFPQSAHQAGHVSDDHDDRSQEVVIISDDDSNDPTSPKEGDDGQQSVSRLRWTISEDCKLVASRCRQKFLWKTIAAGFPNRSSSSCRLRWLKLFEPDDASTNKRWSEMAMLKGDRVMNQWRIMIAQKSPNFYAFLLANHPLKRSYVGGDDNGVGDTTSSRRSVECPGIDLNLSLAI